MNANVIAPLIGDFRQQFFTDTLPMPQPEHDPFSVDQIPSITQFICQHSPQEWESRRPEITRLYVYEKLPLQAVMNTMKAEYGFFGT